MYVLGTTNKSSSNQSAIIQTVPGGSSYIVTSKLVLYLPFFFNKVYPISDSWSSVCVYIKVCNVIWE